MLMSNISSLACRWLWKALIERIRKALIKRYDRDQQIQQMIEEIGAEEGLNETELAIVYQAYLEVKERIYYTSSLVDLWNQIEEVQKRMSIKRDTLVYLQML